MNRLHFPCLAARLAARLAAAAIFALGATAGAQSSLDGPGVSQALAAARRASISGVAYDLSLALSSADSAVGQVAVSFQRRGTGDALLDFRGRRVTAIRVNDRDVPLSATNGHHIRLPAAALRAGVNRVSVGFVTEVAPSGASIIRSRDASDGADYLYTLLVPADANQLFPCFDQPDLKAKVRLTLESPIAWTVIANGSVVRADTAGARVTTHFAETRPLSTYLIAFAAGPWTRASQVANGRTINLYVRRSRAREADADTLLTLSHRALSWMESYFARAYPFEKFDIMLAPAFPFGGMEHPGLVMYNEDRFIFRDRPTLARRMGRFSTILHETAHQWFGDLVTMRWFDDLWLKEGFATYMGAKALAELEPGADAWKTFYQGNKPAAYAVDQTLGTTPLWQSLENLDQAKSAYGAIVYNKAPGVLKQLNYLVGERAFQAGVRDFLTRHAYANATWQDLLRAIGTASGVSLDEFGRNFMTRPGMPIVEPRLTTANGRVVRLELLQRAAQPTISGARPWPMRTRVLLLRDDGRADTLDVALSGTRTVVTAAAGRAAPLVVYPNAGDFGYFLSLLDTASLGAVERGAIRRLTDPMLRSMVWGAVWDQVRDGRMLPGRFAALLLRELPAERDEQIVPSLTGRLERTIRAYLPDSAAANVRAEAEGVLWAMASDAARPFGIRRPALDAYVALAETRAARDRLVAVLVADSAAGEPVRDPLRWSIVDRLTVVDDARADSLLARQARRDTTPDGRRRAFTIGAARPRASVKADYFQRYFADASLNEEWASGSLGGFNAIEHDTLTRPFLRPALDSLPFIQKNRRIFYLGSWLGSFLGGQRSAAAAEIVHQWLTDHPTLALDLRQKVLQTTDELDRTARIRAAAGVR